MTRTVQQRLTALALAAALASGQIVLVPAYADEGDDGGQTLGVVSSVTLPSQANGKPPSWAGKAFSQGIVTAANPYGAEAGAKILEAGGNAIDAAVAIVYALNVVEPQSAGIGGGGFMVIHLARENRTFAIDTREKAPAGATPSMFVGVPNATLQGVAVGVPGMVRGTAMALEQGDGYCCCRANWFRFRIAYTGVFDHVRKLFAAAPESKVRGYQPGRFSFNVKGGRCEECAGDGTIKIEMHFLPDVYVPCEVCKGARTTATRSTSRSKASRSPTCSTCRAKKREFFANQPIIARHMQTIVDVGLGYVRLGQPATTLSGGEAQRVKLASELAKRSTGHTIYLLDEPTTGLHFEDIRRLLGVLDRLVDAGNTVW